MWDPQDPQPPVHPLPFPLHLPRNLWAAAEPAGAPSIPGARQGWGSLGARRGQRGGHFGCWEGAKPLRSPWQRGSMWEHTHVGADMPEHMCVGAHTREHTSTQLRARPNEPPQKKLPRGEKGMGGKKKREKSGGKSGGLLPCQFSVGCHSAAEFSFKLS